MLAVAFGNKLCWLESHYRNISLCIRTIPFCNVESNVDSKWDRVIFTDESTFTSENDGPVLVYRPQGECYNLQCVST